MKTLKSCLILALIILAAFSQAQLGFWPMERQDRYGTGRAPSGPPPANYIAPYVEKYVDLYIVSNGPSIGPNDTGFFGDWVNDKLYKFSTVTGNVLGSAPTGNFVTSTPIVVNSRFIIFTTDNPSTGQVLGLDSGTMQIVWAKTVGRTSIDEYHHASPTIGP